MKIEKGMIKTDLFDFTLSLRDDTFKKKNCKVVYIHNQSNHPKLIRKSITTMDA